MDRGTSADDEESRRRIVAEAIHSGEMEGLTVGLETREDAEDFISGQIDASELVDRVRARYGLGSESTAN